MEVIWGRLCKKIFESGPDMANTTVNKPNNSNVGIRGNMVAVLEVTGDTLSRT